MSEADIPPRTCLPLSITWGESFHAKGTLQCQGHPFPKGIPSGWGGVPWIFGQIPSERGNT